MVSKTVDSGSIPAALANSNEDRGQNAYYFFAIGWYTIRFFECDFDQIQIDIPGEDMNSINFKYPKKWSSSKQVSDNHDDLSKRLDDNLCKELESFFQ